MHELDVLVENPFADAVVSPANNNGTLVTRHPLRTRSTSPAHASSVSLLDGEGETRPRLTRLVSLDGMSIEEAASDSEAPPDSDIIIHPVGPNDSFAGVALRYGISIAALRRANQLWPTDPIHLRTELLIPRGDVLPPRPKSTRPAGTGTTLVSIDPTSGSSPDPVPPTFVAARNMILSVLPARLSLDSLSSKTSVSEDHELEDLLATRALPTTHPAFPEDGHELAMLTTPRTRHKRPPLPLSSQVLCASSNSPHLIIDRITPNRDVHSRSIASSRTVSFERLPRMQPFAAPPVRTSQLEPEPAMELPVRHPAYRGHDH